MARAQLGRAAGQFRRSLWGNVKQRVEGVRIRNEVGNTRGLAQAFQMIIQDNEGLRMRQPRRYGATVHAHLEAAFSTAETVLGWPGKETQSLLC